MGVLFTVVDEELRVVSTLFNFKYFPLHLSLKISHVLERSHSVSFTAIVAEQAFHEAVTTQKLTIIRYGRRPLLLGFGLGTAGSLVLFSALAFVQKHLTEGSWESVTLGWLCIVSMLLFFVCFSIGPGPIPWFISNELVSSIL